MNQSTNNAETFKVGTRIYNSGDMANTPSEGTIVEYRPAGKYIPESVDILYDEPRFDGDDRYSKIVPICLFKSQVGCRFWLLEDWLEMRRAQCRELGLEPQF